MNNCNHEVIAWRGDDGKARLWGCYQCRVKFVPMTQLDAEVKAEREACAKLADDYFGFNAIAAAIRARGQA